jgi:hypothetical protein
MEFRMSYSAQAKATETLAQYVGGDMDSRLLSQDIDEAIRKKWFAIQRANPNMPMRKTYDLAQKGVMGTEKVAQPNNASNGYYARRWRRFAEQLATETGIPYDSALQRVLDTDPKLAQAVMDESNEETESAQATIIALAKSYERAGMETVEAYKKVFRVRPDLKERYERMRGHH